MSNTKDTGFLRNLISYDASGNITLPANLTVTGSLLANGGGSYATQSYVTTQITNLINSAPTALDTLNELAAALGNDANFSTTVTNSIASKLSLSGGTLTGALSGTSATFKGIGIFDNSASGDANSGIRIVAPISTTHYNWMIGAQQNINTGFEITPSTTVGGTTFSTPALSILQSGAATFSSSVTAASIGVNGGNNYSQLESSTGTFGSTVALLSLAIKDGTYNPRATVSFKTQTGSAYSVIFDSAYSTGWGATNWVFNSGNVGIGTTSPAYNLSVASYLGVGAQGGSDIVLIGGGSGVGAFIQLRYATGTTNVHLAGNGNSYLNSSYGSVGVGTTNPAHMLSVQGEIAKYCTTSGVDGNFQNLIKYGYFSDLQSGNSLANRWIGIDATVTAGAAVTNTLRIRAYAGGGGNAVPANVADFRGDQSSVFYGYIKHTTRVFSGNSYVGNLSPNLNTAYTRNYLLVCDLNNAAGFSLNGHMNAASYTCWNMSSFWIMKNYSSTNGSAGITGMYKSGCDMNIVDLNYAGGRYIAIGYTSNPEINGSWIGYRVNHMLNADGSAIVVPDSSVSINATYASY
jgi:hypothetical protein